MRFPIAAFLVSLWLCVFAVPAHALESLDPYRGTFGWRPASIMWGDSTIRRTEPGFRAAGWKGEVDAVSSRSVERLLPLVQERVRSKARIDTAVFGLGVNGGSGKFTKWQYQESVRLVKKHSPKARVIILAPYRDGTWWDTTKTAERARWAREVAGANSRSVCVADWAAKVQPEHLTDGLHPDEHGVGGEVFVKTIMDRAKYTCI